MKGRIITADEIKLVDTTIEGYNNLTYCYFPKNTDDAYYGTRKKSKNFYYTHGESLYDHNVINFDDAQAIGKIRSDAANYNYWIGFEKSVTLEEMKEKLEGSILQYSLNEEIIEAYSEEQKEAYKQIKNAKTYKETTHIFSEDEISPEFEEEHLVDLETYINNKLEITSSDIDIQELPSIQETVQEEYSMKEPREEGVETSIGGEVNG